MKIPASSSVALASLSSLLALDQLSNFADGNGLSLYDDWLASIESSGMTGTYLVSQRETTELRVILESLNTDRA